MKIQKLKQLASQLADNKAWEDLLDIPSTMLYAKLHYNLSNQDCIRLLFLAIETKRERYLTLKGGSALMASK